MTQSERRLQAGAHGAAVREVEVDDSHKRQVERKVAPVALRLQRAPLAGVQRGVRADHCSRMTRPESKAIQDNFMAHSCSVPGCSAPCLLVSSAACVAATDTLS